MRYYILGNQVVVPASGAMEFGKWVETADRIVSKTQVADIEVSTMFLGIDHQFYNGPPLLFETMVFGAILIKPAAAVRRGMKPWSNMKRSCQKC
jgi:hypothetical protein